MAASAQITAALEPAQAERVDAALGDLTPEQLQWVSGYAAGIAAARSGPAADRARSDPPAATGKALTILYASQTGNGESIANEFAARAKAAGFDVSLEPLADFRLSRLRRQKLVTFIVSTHGDGDPPDDAELFREALLSDAAPRLDGVRYSVLALGDSSYVNFCETGREFDQRLESLGAERFAPITECDVDYESTASAWAERMLERLPALSGRDSAAPRLHAVTSPARSSRDRPYAARVLANQRITADASSKDVRHIELSLEGSGMDYEPGDSLAVVATNPPALVEQLLATLGFDGEEEVVVGDEAHKLSDALSSKLEITALNLPFLRACSEFDQSAGLAELLGDSKALAELVATHQVIDVLRRFPGSPDPQRFADALRPLGARSYSIASSPTANPDEVHLTVAAVRYDAFGSEHWGAASTHLADRLAAGDEIPVYLEANPRFRLPADDATDIIMIAAGTGIAPFRAFVEQRAERAATGRSWLFFGERNFSSDFLYQLEWQRHLRGGNLTRLDVAFSRDQDRRIYVQDRVAQHGAEIVRWLEAGAQLYVCGDASSMAEGVDGALRNVLADAYGIDEPGARQKLRALKQSGRYQRDVY